MIVNPFKNNFKFLFNCDKDQYSKEIIFKITIKLLAIELTIELVACAIT
jgi:hypothetical protein